MSDIDFGAFRDPALARKLIDAIRRHADGRTLNLMEVCGTHTVSIGRYGFRSIMPDGLKLLSGPGCPVCVTANRDIDHAIALSDLDDVIIATFGDMMRVPGSTSSLMRKKSEGRDIRIVYSPLDAIALAESNPDRHVVFLGVGFETTTPTIAATILEAEARGLPNFSVFCAHKVTPPALRAIADDPRTRIDGFILPGHVSTITGIAPYRFLVDEYGIPGVVTGFEPVDILEGIEMLTRMIRDGSPDIVNAYRRGVSEQGNPVAREHVAAVFDGTGADSGPYPPRVSPSRSASPPSMRASGSTSPSSRPASRAAAAVATCCAERSPPSTARCSDAPAPPSTPLDPAWSPARAPAPRTSAIKRHSEVAGAVLRWIFPPAASTRPRETAREGFPSPVFLKGDVDMDATVLLGHGSGGQMMKRIIDELFLQEFASPELLAGDDAGVAPLAGTGRIAMSTDSFVVTPQFFPGGDIGRLAVCGTVNDVATSGARVRYLSCGFILEEGYPMDKLRAIVHSMALAVQEAGVKIITGDTKVVERGGADGVYINTAGIGEVPEHIELSGASCRPGDKVLVSGTLGDHGIAIMSQREGLAFSTSIESDAAPLNHLISDVLAAAPHARCFRDPTRGGLASTLNEFACASRVDITIDEDAVPVRPEVRAACEMLGYDALQVANEGKMVAVVPADEAEAALTAMRANRYGADAAIIGEVAEAGCAAGGRPLVRVRCGWGATRVLDMLVGEQLPRIC